MINIGISGNPLEPKIRRHFDGIGVYTNAIYDNLKDHQDIKIQPFAYTKVPDKLCYSKVIDQSYGHAVLKNLVLKQTKNLNVDVMHFTDYHVVDTRCPSIATVHDAIPLMHPEWVSSRHRTLKNALMKKMVNKADAFIAVSQYATAELTEYFGLPQERIQVIPCGIDANWLKPIIQDEDILKKYGLQPHFFLAVGTFQPRKNFDQIIHSYFQLPESIRKQHQLVIVGKQGWHCDSTIQLIQDYQRRYANQLVWLNQVETREDIKQLYLHALSLVFASLYEGFGIPILEAFTTQTPVITSDTSSMPEVVGNAGLVINPYQKDDITQAMLDISQSEQLRLDFIQKGHHQLQKFHWDKISQQLIEFYKSVI